MKSISDTFGKSQTKGGSPMDEKKQLNEKYEKALKEIEREYLESRPEISEIERKLCQAFFADFCLASGEKRNG
jgi:hypothetical protein